MTLYKVRQPASKRIYLVKAKNPQLACLRVARYIESDDRPYSWRQAGDGYRLLSLFAMKFDGINWRRQWVWNKKKFYFTNNYICCRTMKSTNRIRDWEAAKRSIDAQV